MSESIDHELGERGDLTSRVLRELRALRGKPGRLTIQKFSQFEALRLVCGGNDLLDAFMMFRREMRRYQAGGRDEAAAALSICAEADTVLDRLQLTAEALSGDEPKDQRSARRWSDSGCEVIAAELVYLAEVRGRLGTELLNVEVGGSTERGLVLTLDQMNQTPLPTPAPLIRLWEYTDEEEPEERALTADLDEYPAVVASRDDYTMRRHRIAVEVPALPDVQDDTKLLSISIEGRDAPMRTVVLEDRTNLPQGFVVSFAVYRTIVTVDLVATPNK